MDASTASITFTSVLQWIWQHLLTIIVVLGLFFEIAPIKINPISWLCKLIFKPVRDDLSKLKTEMNTNMDVMKADLKNDISVVKSDLSNEIDGVKTQMQSEISVVKLEIDNVKAEQQNQSNTINDLIKSNETSEIARIRWDILEFSNSIDNGQVHTRDEYRHIKDNAVRYHTLIEKYNITNGIIDEEMEKINTHYENNKNGSSIYF